MTRNAIDTNEARPNQARRFGAAGEYHPVFIRNDFGRWQPCLLTDDQIKVGIERARTNPEDVPKRTRWWEFWK
jgi:hypothetical protein